MNKILKRDQLKVEIFLALISPYIYGVGAEVLMIPEGEIIYTHYLPWSFRMERTALQLRYVEKFPLEAHLVSGYLCQKTRYNMVTHLHNIARITYNPESTTDESKGFLHFIFASEPDLQESLVFLNELREKDLMFHVTVTGEKILAEIYESGKKIADTGYVNCDRPSMFKYKSEKRYKADSLLGTGFLNSNKIVPLQNDVFEPVKYTLEAMEVL